MDNAKEKSVQPYQKSSTKQKKEEEQAEICHKAVLLAKRIQNNNRLFKTGVCNFYIRVYVLAYIEIDC